MGVIKIDIRYANGERESALVEGERALIGSASFCDVRLPMDQAAYEHVLIEVHGGTLRAEAKVDSPAATINGMPFAASAIAPDAVLGIGNIRLFVSFVPDEVDSPQVNAKKKEDNSNALIRAIGVVGFAVAAYWLLADPETPMEPAPSTAIQLFAESQAGCPQAQPEAALALAQEKLSQAEGKRERLPFDVRQGVAAVPLYDQAVACFKAANHANEAKDAESERDSLKRSMSDDFRARRLRLEHMLVVQDYELAKKDVVVLQDMTEDKHGDYVEWLASVRKRLYPKKAEE
jgi:hypothetical protein